MCCACWLHPPKLDLPPPTTTPTRRFSPSLSVSASPFTPSLTTCKNATTVILHVFGPMEHRNDEQLAQLKKLVAEARADTARFCRYIKVARLAVRTTSDSSAFARLLALSSPGTPAGVPILSDHLQ